MLPSDDMAKAKRVSEKNVKGIPEDERREKGQGMLALRCPLPLCDRFRRLAKELDVKPAVLLEAALDALEGKTGEIAK